MSDRATYDRLVAFGRSDERVLSVLDLARSLARRAGDLAPLLRALAIEPISRQRAADGSLETASDGEQTCVCAGAARRGCWPPRGTTSSDSRSSRP